MNKKKADLLPLGVIEKLGFFEGSKGSALLGWIDQNWAKQHKILLLLNGQVVSETYAGRKTVPVEGAKKESKLLEFAFRCDDLMAYLGDGDTIEIVCDNEPLYISSHGYKLVIKNNQDSRADEVLDRLQRGYVFDNLGRLIRVKDEESVNKIFFLYEDLGQFIKKRYGYDLMVCFGALLGAVRENNFIKHDTRGLDAIYISDYTKPEEVVGEFKQICFDLIEAGYMVRINPESAYVNSLESGSRFVDLNYGWFTENDELNVAFGWYEEPARGRDKYFTFRETMMAGKTIRIPGNAEEILYQCYGQNWHIPDQGFMHDISKRVVKTEYLIPYEEVISMLHGHLKHTYQAWKYEKENNLIKSILKKIIPLPFKRFYHKIVAK